VRGVKCAFTLKIINSVIGFELAGFADFVTENAKTAAPGGRFC
jgi:hypothetical protein